MSKIMVDCPNCEGTGDDPDSTDEDGCAEPCPECSGTGEVDYENEEPEQFKFDPVTGRKI